MCYFPPDPLAASGPFRSATAVLMMSVTLLDEMVAPVTALISLGPPPLPPLTTVIRSSGALAGELAAPLVRDDLVAEARGFLLLQDKDPRNFLRLGIEPQKQFDLVGIALPAGLDDPAQAFASFPGLKYVVGALLARLLNDDALGQGFQGLPLLGTSSGRRLFPAPAPGPSPVSR